jgi:hypothetical protein
MRSVYENIQAIYKSSSYKNSLSVTMPIKATQNKVLIIKRHVGQETGHARRVLNAIATRILPRSQSMPNLRPSLVTYQTQSNSNPISSSLSSSNTFNALTMGNVDFRRSPTSLSKSLDPYTNISRGYACRTGNVAEPSTQITDPKALQNNPAL